MVDKSKLPQDAIVMGLALVVSPEKGTALIVDGEVFEVVDPGKIAKEDELLAKALAAYIYEDLSAALEIIAKNVEPEAVLEWLRDKKKEANG